jgi:Tol biopolymer transport system component
MRYQGRGCVAVLLLMLALGASAAPQGVIARRWTPPELSTDQYESSPSFTPDGREMFFMLADRNFDNYRVMWSRCRDGAWTAPVEAPFSAPRPALEADPFVTIDGRFVYFVSSRQDPQRENLDIWVAARAEDGSWSRAAQRLPEPVNSAAPELLPRLTEDGELWFGSSRPGGFGQGDIYIARRSPDGEWTVDNAEPPISTPAYEYEADISRDGRTLIVVANRGTRSHLYRYRKIDATWVEKGQLPAAEGVFQVGPLLSPDGKRLLFAQRDGKRSGELFLLDLDADADRSWPQGCLRQGRPD